MNRQTRIEIEEIEFPFSVKMESIAGEIAFDHQAILVKEEREEDESNWYLNWDTTFIFPDLEVGDTIGLSTVSALRGEIVDKNGEELAFTGRAYEIGIVPGKMEDQEKAIIERVADLLGISTEQIEKALSATWVKPDHCVPIKKISLQETELSEQLIAVPSVQNTTGGCKESIPWVKLQDT